MNKDKVQSKNPTPITIIEEVMKVFESQTLIVETFLMEFCRVNGIEESALNERLQIVACLADSSISVINVKESKNVEFEVKSVVDTSSRVSFSVRYEVTGEYLNHKEDYPETTKLLESYGGGNATTTSGE